MPSSGHFREGDLDLIMHVIQEAAADDPGVAMPWSVLEGLLRLVPCDIALTFADFAVEWDQPSLHQGIECGQRFVVQEDSGDEEALFASMFWGSPFCSYPQRTGDLISVIHDGDFFGSGRDRRTDRMQAELFEPVGFTHCMIVSLPAAAGRLRRLLFRRGPGPGFSERDRQVLAVLRPHLQEIWLAAERRRVGVPNLTAREWQVLALAAANFSNADIAAKLVVSEGTVRKHMDHIRERLGVRTRAAAAAAALPHLSLVQPLADGVPPKGPWAASTELAGTHQA